MKQHGQPKTVTIAHPVKLPIPFSNTPKLPMPPLGKPSGNGLTK